MRPYLPEHREPKFREAGELAGKRAQPSRDARLGRKIEQVAAATVAGRRDGHGLMSADDERAVVGEARVVLDAENLVVAHSKNVLVKDPPIGETAHANLDFLDR